MSGAKLGTVKGGTLSFDLHTLCEHLSEDARINLIRFLVAEETLFAAVLQAVVDGHYHQDDPDGEWWFGSERTAKLRETLLPLMSDIAAKLVGEHAHQRDQAKLLERRANDWAWALYHAWPDGARRDRPEMRRDFPFANYMSEEAAREMVAKAESEVL